jgi:DNA-binding NarL/FixJ family response regulator
MSARILIVDDHRAWRQQISEKLRNDLRYRVIGEAVDGLDAVRAAETLKPDLLVLDIGLPKLNGLEVARQVLASAPQLRILFLSEQHSPEFAEAALATGAYGYVVKSDAGSELLPAITALVEGRTFIGARFDGAGIERSLIQRVPQSVCHHEALFTTDEACVAEGYARFIEDALSAGGSAIIVAPPARRHVVFKRLRARHVNVDDTIAQARFVSLDVDETLSTFMRDGWPDETAFLNVSKTLVASAAAASRAPQPRVAACGECSPTVMKRGNVEAAIRLEHMWDDLVAKSGVDVFCGYLQEADRPAERHTVQRLCDLHSAVHWT